MIVVTECEGDMLMIEDVSAINRLPCAIGRRLVHHRLELANGFILHLHQQVTTPVDGNQAGALNFEFDPTRISFRGHHKIVFQLMRIPVNDPINPRVNLLVTDGRVVGYVAAPLRRIVADEVIADAGLLHFCAKQGLWPGMKQAKTYPRPSRRFSRCPVMRSGLGDHLS